MPMYTFTTRDGSEQIRRSYPMSKAPRLGQKIRIGRKVYHRVLDWRRGETNSQLGTLKPHVSLSNAVLPHQVPQAMELDKRLGVPIRYDGKGRAIFDGGRKQKQRWLKAHHRVDHDAGYGDPTPGDFS